MNRAVVCPPDRHNYRRSYGLAGLGSIATAGAQLLLSLQLLHAVSPAQFGSFAFLLVCAQFSLGIAVALLCAPYPAALQTQAQSQTRLTASFFAANLVLALATALVLGSAGYLLLGLGEGLVFAGFGALNLLRWFGRAHAYGQQQQGRVVASDLGYGLVLLTGCGLLAIGPGASLVGACWALLASALAGFLALGPDFLRQQLAALSLRALPDYRAIWKSHARWSLLGVVTTEGTANAHVYLVTMLAGPQAFAPLAASALLIRPLALAMNALGDLERPRLARWLAQNGSATSLSGATRFFTRTLLAVWVGCLVLALVVLLWQPRLVFPIHYELDLIWTGALVWFAIALLRCLRLPKSVLLQAAGRFGPLAFTSLWSCAISLAAVAALVAHGEIVWSLLGILLGEAVFALGVRGEARRLGNAFLVKPDRTGLLLPIKAAG